MCVRCGVNLISIKKISTNNGVPLVKWSEKGLKCLHCRPVFVFVVFGEDPEIEAQEKERNTLNFMTKKNNEKTDIYYSRYSLHKIENSVIKHLLSSLEHKAHFSSFVIDFHYRDIF